MHLTRVENSDTKRVSLFWHTRYIHIKKTVLRVHSLQTDHIKNGQAYLMNMTFFA